MEPPMDPMGPSGIHRGAIGSTEGFTGRPKRVHRGGHRGSIGGGVCVCYLCVRVCACVRVYMREVSLSVC